MPIMIRMLGVIKLFPASYYTVAKMTTQHSPISRISMYFIEVHSLASSKLEIRDRLLTFYCSDSDLVPQFTTNCKNVNIFH